MIEFLYCYAYHRLTIRFPSWLVEIDFPSLHFRPSEITFLNQNRSNCFPSFFERLAVSFSGCFFNSSNGWFCYPSENAKSHLNWVLSAYGITPYETAFLYPFVDDIPF